MEISPKPPIATLDNKTTPSLPPSALNQKTALPGKKKRHRGKKTRHISTPALPSLATWKKDALCHNHKKYTQWKHLSSGCTASISSAVDEKNTPVAVKEYNNELHGIENWWLKESKIIKLAEKVQHTVRFIDVFRDINNRKFLVTPLHGKPLFTHYNQKGLPIHDIKQIGIQLLEFLSGMKTTKLIHADLTPTNIVFKNIDKEEKDKEIVVIDFGLSMLAEENNLGKLVQLLMYRSPEVILKHSFDYAIDIWSVGCILFELYAGQPFVCEEGEDGENQTYINTLDQIHRRLGRLPPASFIEESTLGNDYYQKTSLSSSSSSSSSYQLASSFKPNHDNSGMQTVENVINQKAKENNESEKGKALSQLLSSMLTYEKRISPEAALELIKAI